jgi:transcriptional regulator GlxA family with amidase domain
VNLVGLCTGSFVLARAGLLDGYVACVSWFHRQEFTQEFPNCRVTSKQMYMVDRDRLTCAGGTSAVHLAAYVIEQCVSRASAVKALRIMIERQPLPPGTLQPEEVLSEKGRDSLVKNAMLLIEQNLAVPLRVEQIAGTLHIGRRQLERRFHRDVGMTPSNYRERLRVDRSRWLLEQTDLQVAEVALECGFQSSTYLGRIIRRHFGCTPLQMRHAKRVSAYGERNSCAASSRRAKT